MRAGISAAARKNAGAFASESERKIPGAAADIKDAGFGTAQDMREFPGGAAAPEMVSV